MRNRRSGVETYFSKAERAYADYLHANRMSMLGAAARPASSTLTAPQAQGTMSTTARSRPTPSQRSLDTLSAHDLDLSRNKGDEEAVVRDDAPPVARAQLFPSAPTRDELSRRGSLRGRELPPSDSSSPQSLNWGESGFESPSAVAKPKNEANERAHQQAAENAGRFADYNDGDIAKTVDTVVDSSSWSDRRFGIAGKGINGKGRYIWTKYGWVDLQHVIGAATTTNDPMLNELLGVAKEIEQLTGGMRSGFKREDLLSNAIGASALAYQRIFGGTIGQAIAHVLKRYRPTTSQEAAEFLRNDGQAEPWP